MNSQDRHLAKQISQQLLNYSQSVRQLAGAPTTAHREALAKQLVEGVRRVQYVERLPGSQISAARAIPGSGVFDPLRAAVLKRRAGDIDEAFWLVFVATHFGKHRHLGWRLAEEVYGALGGQPWTWHRASSDLAGLRAWLANNEKALTGKFSNHRQYRTLRASSPDGPASVLESYIAWVGANRGHAAHIADATSAPGTTPEAAFDHLYQAMKGVRSFGRLGRFDYLTMIGKLGLAPIHPGSPYLQGASGPLFGARLLFDGNAKSKTSANVLDAEVIKLGNQLGLGMQVMEDGICNWQKSPSRFVPFRG